MVQRIILPGTPLHADLFNALDTLVSQEYNGNPNGHLAAFGRGIRCWDYANSKMYQATVADGTIGGTTWTQIPLSAFSGTGGATQPITVDDETGTISGSRQAANGNVTTVNTATSGKIKIDLDNTAVTPASYTSANITVDAQGRLTDASNGGSATPTNALAMSQALANSARTNVGIGADTLNNVGGAVGALNTGYMIQRLTSSGSIDSQMSVISAGTVLYGTQVATFQAVFYGEENTGVRYIVGLANSSTQDNADTGTGAYFRFSTNTGDTEWKAVTGTNVQSTGISFDTAAPHLFKIVQSATDTKFYIDGTLVSTNTSGLPSSSNSLRYMVSGRALANATKHCNIGTISVTS